MPLVIIVGMPCTGKSRCAEMLSAYFTERNKTVVLVSEHDCIQTRNTYCSSDEEKTLRANLKAEVVRRISPDAIVIMDAPNYIKGYRYELFLVAKQHRTTHCVVECAAPVEQAWQWNCERPPQLQYSESLFNELIARYEAPSSCHRWDNPLFTSMKDRAFDIQGIQEALFSGRVVKPNQCTQLLPLTHNNFLHDLNNLTQEVIASILKAQEIDPCSDVKVNSSTKMFTVGRKVTLPELSRARRQFITFFKNRPSTDRSEAISCFVTYLNTTLS